MNENIAILGLGAMGARMAQRLLDAGHRLRVFNRDPRRAEPFTARGARVAESPRAAAKGADLVLSMVRDDPASADVWLDAQRGALAGMASGAVAIECSTTTTAHVARLSTAMQQRGVRFIDAPVVGSRPQAQAGQLVFLAGGDAAVLSAVDDVLRAMGGAVHHCGPTGSGMALKLVVNALFGIQVAALGELLGLLDRAGVEPDGALQVLSQLPVTAPALTGVAKLLGARNFAPMFPVDLVEKDFGYVEDAAAALRVDTPTVHAARAVYAKAKGRGLGGENIHAVMKLYA